MDPQPCKYCRYVPWDGECCAAVRLERERDRLAEALEAIIAEPWLSGGLDACTIASAALYPAALDT